ncbi:hypothetical protein FJ930_06800 [Mesorhizobium sp. B2-4-15]|uniref:hypothetical protein n=1 Tax=Mesorhizobium sp. B2-4-15 TaxID=2589934 RepID=UPI001152B2A5|nr:hypothetical protein [Mesorhizobium sp. B2-4-15]TPK74713.1 hypothetical protein FJ930_06800 [Mesorhizobium sp. B2-4-15]
MRELPALPVYTPDDYSLIRQLPGAGDMPPTWEEWHRNFDATNMESLEGLTYAPVRIEPDLFKVWLDSNSQVASEHCRQIYAQELLDARKAKYESRREDERARRLIARMANEPLPADPLTRQLTKIGALSIVMAAAIGVLITLCASGS